LDSFQLTLGCSSQCNFCAEKTPRGPISRFGIDAIRHFLEKQIGNMVIGDLLRNNTISLYDESEPFDHSQYEEICSLFESEGIKIRDTLTSYPDVENMDERLQNFLKTTKNEVRLSVGTKNYPRLIKDGWLEIASSGNNKYLQPTQKSLLFPNLKWSYRFTTDTIDFEDGPIKIRDFNKRIHATTSGIMPYGRAKNMPGTEKPTIYGDNGVTLTPSGFYNILCLDVRHGEQWNDVPESGGKPTLKVKIKKHFTTCELYNDIMSGKKDIITIHELLSIGVIENTALLKKNQPGLLVLDFTTAKNGNFYLHLPTTDKAEPSILKVYYRFDSQVGVTIEKVERIQGFHRETVFHLEKTRPSIDKKYEDRRKKYDLKDGQKIEINGEHCVFLRVDNKFFPNHLFVQNEKKETVIISMDELEQNNTPVIITQ
jgi:hypothetical protein